MVETKPWQQGYDITYLQNLEARFAEYNEHSCSPFSEMNKPKIADALHHNRMKIHDWGMVSETTVTTATDIKIFLDVVMARKIPGDKVIDAFVCEHPSMMVKYL